MIQIENLIDFAFEYFEAFYLYQFTAGSDIKLRAFPIKKNSKNFWPLVDPCYYRKLQ